MSTDILINDTLPKVQYIATSGQTTFVYNFPILDKSDIEVYRTPFGQQPDDNAQLLTLDSDYSVTGAGQETGGNIVMNIAINANDRITIQRAMPYQRLSSYKRGKQFNAESLDVDFNSVILMIQQIHAYYKKRFLSYENTIVDDTSNFRLPTLSSGQIWKHNGSGLAAVTLEENPDWSTLRAELANQSVGTDGSRLVGYQDAIIGSTTIHAAIQTYISMYAIDEGSANNIIITIPGFIGYREGMRILVKISADNTTAVTININSAGIKSVKLQSDEELPSRTLIIGMIAELFYDGSKFVIINPFESHSDSETGDVMASTRTSKVGWVLMDDGTIGSPESSATTLKSNLCKDLFIHLWNTFNNTMAPVPEGRGANAEADWLANKQIQLLHFAGRTILASGHGFGLTTRILGTSLGSETHSLTANENGPHSHNVSPGASRLTGESTSPTHDVGVGAGQVAFFSPVTDSRGSGTPFSIMQPSTVLNIFIKL